ncbi:MAG: hypothetical protein ABIJ12_01940 [bacterium]
MVFKTKDFADFINSNYVALKLDGDTDLGRKLRNQWLVPGYPTMMFFTAEGEEIDRIVGFDGNKDEYFQLVKDYTNDKNTLEDLLSRLKTDAENAQLNFEIASKYNDRGDDEKALIYFENVLKLELDHSSEMYLEAEYNVAESKAFNEDNPAYLQHYARNCSNEHLKYYAYSSLTRFFRLKKDQANVISTYEEALTGLPDNASMMNSYAWYIFQNKVDIYYERGIDVAKKAVEVEPEADSIWDTLGQLLFEAGYTDKAIEAMQGAVDLAPDEASYKENLKRYKASKT